MILIINKNMNKILEMNKRVTTLESDIESVKHLLVLLLEEALDDEDDDEDDDEEDEEEDDDDFWDSLPCFCACHDEC